MNQTLLPSVIDSLMSMLPTAKPKAMPAVMTRREKLQRWADIVRAHTGTLNIFHLLERQLPEMLASIGDRYSAFHLAGTDQMLRDHGLKRDLPPTLFGTATTSAAEVMRFFELSQAELHEFSCDCGGDITPANMATRIEGIARGT